MNKKIDPCDFDMHWEKWSTQKDNVSRDFLITQHWPFVKAMARNISKNLPSSVDFDDLASAGMFGLINAIEQFDPSCGLNFSSFASQRIRFAIYDELRLLDWVPKDVRRKVRDIERVSAEQRILKGRTLTEKELAVYFDVKVSTMRKWQAIVNDSIVGSLDHSIENGYEPSYNPSALEALENHELQEIIQEAINHLPERERLVLSLYYNKDLTFGKIGQELGVTESRVCQIHTKSVKHIKKCLTKWNSLQL